MQSSVQQERGSEQAACVASLLRMEKTPAPRCLFLRTVPQCLALVTSKAHEAASAK